MGVVFGKQTVAEPAYTTLLSRPQYEIRKYGQRFAAETIGSENNGGDNNDSSFRVLAQYIGVFGTPENEGETKIDMTAPVVMEEATKISMTAPVVMQKDQRLMQFILPEKYDSMDKIPKPTNDRVKITSIPPAKGAVHRYSGSYSPELAEEKAKHLYAQLKNDGLTDISESYVLSNYQFWGFNPPFTLPMFRRNEVWVSLTDEQVEKLIKENETTLVN